MKLKEEQDKFLVVQDTDDAAKYIESWKNYRIVDDILTSCPPNRKGAEKSSQFYIGQVIYSEGNNASRCIVEDPNGYLTLIDSATNTIATLYLYDEVLFSSVAAFIKLCWSTFPNMDSNVVFDSILEQYI